MKMAELYGTTTEAVEALTQSLEYFEDRADVIDDGDYGRPRPNREMQLAALCKDALSRLGAP